MAAEVTSRAFAGDGRRDTRQRRALREFLTENDSFLSAQQLHEEMRRSGDKVGLVTVYRTLQAMAEAGEVDAIRLDGGETVYRQCGPRHHHHLVCRNCGTTVEVDGPSVERWADAAAAEHGFSEVTHVVELFGLCARCTAEAAER